jgi:hypothetical protein
MTPTPSPVCARSSTTRCPDRHVQLLADQFERGGDRPERLVVVEPERRGRRRTDRVRDPPEETTCRLVAPPEVDPAAVASARSLTTSAWVGSKAALDAFVMGRERYSGGVRAAAPALGYPVIAAAGRPLATPDALKRLRLRRRDILSFLVRPTY